MWGWMLIWLLLFSRAANAKRGINVKDDDDDDDDESSRGQLRQQGTRRKCKEKKNK